MATRSPYGALTEAMYAPSDPLKEVKDMSKNLVSGDFEREYSGVLEKRNRRRQAWAVTVVIAFVVAFLWLLALTLVREVQVVRLREDVEQLSANMVVVSAKLETLSQKVASNKIFNEFKFADDMIYTDDSQEKDSSNHLPSSSNDDDTEDLEKLKKITTVLEDEEETDDEDIYDNDDDEESGDWYSDYDRRTEKIGYTNMVKLTPEEFTGSVVTLGKGQKTNSAIRELKRILKENPEAPDDALLAAVSSSNAEATSEKDRRGKRSVFPDYPQEVDHIAHPSYSKQEDRRKSKKYIASPPAVVDLLPQIQKAHTSGRSVRNSDIEEEGRRKFVAAHFHGNTSHLSTDIHQHYNSNGLVRVAHDAPHDVWYPSPWTLASPSRPTLTRNGHVHVHHTGVYLVYVQIYYLDSHDIISWVLHRTNPETNGREAVLQCAQSSHAPGVGDRPNSCFSASALFLKAGDRLAVRNTGGDRHSLMQPEKSFIGLVKLADAQDPNDIEL